LARYKEKIKSTGPGIFCQREGPGLPGPQEVSKDKGPANLAAPCRPPEEVGLTTPAMVPAREPFLWLR